MSSGVLGTSALNTADRPELRVLDWRVMGLALATYLIITLSICAALHLMFPGTTQGSTWITFLRDANWQMSWSEYAYGVAEAMLFAGYTALVFCPLYNGVARFIRRCELVLEYRLAATHKS